MAYNYTRARARSLRQIKKYGGANQVYSSPVSSGMDSSGDPIETPDQIVVDGFSTPLASYKAHEINDDILATDSWVYFDSDDVPAIDMLITVSGVEFRIHDISAIESPDGDLIVRKLQLRG